MCACFGERMMKFQLGQTSTNSMVEPLWCDHTQDMSGYVHLDTTSLLLDEEFQFQTSTAQHEITESMSPILRDSLNATVGQEFNNYVNHTILESETKALLPKISDTEIDDFTKTTMMDENEDLFLHINSESQLLFPETLKEETKPLVNISKKPSFLSLFDCKEPMIKEDLESTSPCCTDSKLAFELKDDTDVAEEIVVTTEYDDDSESKQSSLLVNNLETLNYPFESNGSNFSSEFTEQMLSPLGNGLEAQFDFNKINNYDEDLLFNFEPEVSCSDLKKKSLPKLRLDLITTTIDTSAHLIEGALADTPDVLKPVLEPELGFDLLKFVMTTNNENSSIDLPEQLQSRPCKKRKGKSILSLTALKESQHHNSEGKLRKASEVASPRPIRQSAIKFKNRMQKAFDSDISDEKKFVTKTKGRKKQSDAACESIMKYRERRDRNNVSSKLSRQRRKMKQQQMNIELSELEVMNIKLKRKSEKLQEKLMRVNKAFKQFFIELRK